MKKTRRIPLQQAKKLNFQHSTTPVNHSRLGSLFRGVERVLLPSLDRRRLALAEFRSAPFAESRGAHRVAVVPVEVQKQKIETKA